MENAPLPCESLGVVRSPLTGYGRRNPPNGVKDNSQRWAFLVEIPKVPKGGFLKKPRTSRPLDLVARSYARSIIRLEAITTSNKKLLAAMGVSIFIIYIFSMLLYEAQRGVPCLVVYRVSITPTRVQTPPPSNRVKNQNMTYTDLQLREDPNRHEGFRRADRARHPRESKEAPRMKTVQRPTHPAMEDKWHLRIDGWFFPPLFRRCAIKHNCLHTDMMY